MGLLKIFVICLLLSATPSAAGDIEHVGYPVVSFTIGVEEALRNQEWTMCGKYFAKIESEKDKTVAFSYVQRSPDEIFTAPLVAFSKAELINPSIDEKATSPTVIILRGRWKDRVLLRMNLEDYKTGLPCLGKGTKM